MIQFNIEKIKNEIERKFTDRSFIAPTITDTVKYVLGNRKKFYAWCNPNPNNAYRTILIASGVICIGRNYLRPADFLTTKAAIDKLIELMLRQMLNIA